MTTSSKQRWGIICLVLTAVTVTIAFMASGWREEHQDDYVYSEAAQAAAAAALEASERSPDDPTVIGDPDRAAAMQEIAAAQKAVEDAVRNQENKEDGGN